MKITIELDIGHNSDRVKWEALEVMRKNEIIHPITQDEIELLAKDFQVVTRSDGLAREDFYRSSDRIKKTLGELKRRTFV